MKKLPKTSGVRIIFKDDVQMDKFMNSIAGDDGLCIKDFYDDQSIGCFFSDCRDCWRNAIIMGTLDNTLLLEPEELGVCKLRLEEEIKNNLPDHPELESYYRALLIGLGVSKLEAVYFVKNVLKRKSEKHSSSVISKLYPLVDLGKFTDSYIGNFFNNDDNEDISKLF